MTKPGGLLSNKLMGYCLKLDDGIDPISVVRYPRHNSRLVLLSTAYSPGYNSCQVPLSIGHSHHRRPPRVSLQILTFSQNKWVLLVKLSQETISKIEDVEEQAVAILPSVVNLILNEILV